MSDEKDATTKQKSLWCAALEIFCHQVLFVRRVYPKETFCSTRFLGVQCKANRHPGVVDYISETIRVIVPALFDGASNEISLVIFDQANNVQHEKYSLCLSQIPKASDEEHEREMRDLILSVYTLEGLDSPAWNSSITFKITLFLPSENQNCKELNQVLSEGKWFCPDTNSSRAKEKRRPVHHMSNSACMFYFQTNLAE
jgi:hypothetical protein